MSLESALDDLYAVEPAEFVATRTTFGVGARAGKDAGRGEGIGVGRRRPTRSAWAINQVTRQPTDGDRGLGPYERHAPRPSRQGGSGFSEALRAASAAHRAALNDAINAALNAAIEQVGGTPSDAIRTEIETTFQAASVDPSVATDVRLGRLSTARTASTVFPEAERSNAPAPARGPTCREAGHEGRSRTRSGVASRDCASRQRRGRRRRGRSAGGGVADRAGGREGGQRR